MDRNDFKSQVGQDEWVCEFFNFKKDGYFIEIGANNGINYSNTYYLEKILNWNGVCIEAGKESFEELTKNRNSLCINKAISDKNGFALFNENKFIGSLSNKGNQKIETTTISKLLSSYDIPKKIDYISLDIEGHELSVLNDFPFDDYDVTLWTIETINRKNLIRNLMFSHGYEAFDGELKNQKYIPINNKIITRIMFEDWFFKSDIK